MSDKNKDLTELKKTLNEVANKYGSSAYEREINAQFLRQGRDAARKLNDVCEKHNIASNPAFSLLKAIADRLEYPGGVAFLHDLGVAFQDISSVVKEYGDVRNAVDETLLSPERDAAHLKKDSALVQAIEAYPQHRTLAQIDALLQDGANPNAYIRNGAGQVFIPLLLAVGKNEPVLINRLIDAGASVQRHLTTDGNRAYNDPLLACGDRADCVSLLVSRGCQPDVRDLYFARRHGHEKSAAVLSPYFSDADVSRFYNTHFRQGEEWARKTRGGPYNGFGFRV